MTPNRKHNPQYPYQLLYLIFSDGAGEEIVKNYFNYKVNSKTKQRLRTIGDVVVKVMYIVVSIIAMKLTDDVLDGKFLDFGLEWMKWNRLKNSLAHDYMGELHEDSYFIFIIIWNHMWSTG